MHHIQRRIDPQDPVGPPELVDIISGVNNCNKCKIEYNKLRTAGNNPTITKSKQLSQYVRTVEHTSELQSHHELECRLLLEKQKVKNQHQGY